MDEAVGASEAGLRPSAQPEYSSTAASAGHGGHPLEESASLTASEREPAESPPGSQLSPLEDLPSGEDSRKRSKDDENHSTYGSMSQTSTSSDNEALTDELKNPRLQIEWDKVMREAWRPRKGYERDRYEVNAISSYMTALTHDP